jgi:hypothetical protein
MLMDARKEKYSKTENDSSSCAADRVFVVLWFMVWGN